MKRATRYEEASDESHREEVRSRPAGRAPRRCVGPRALPGQGGQPPLVPPQSHAFGKSFEQWNVLYSEWAIASGLGGATDLSETLGQVRFLPADLFDPSPEFHVTLPPGTPFVAPPFVVWGGRYDDPDVPDDNPADPILDDFFETAEIQTVLDGYVLLGGTGTELEPFRFGPVYFDEPIVFAEPQPSGPGLNSTAALFVVGIGSVYHPLPVGQHTLVTTVHSFFGDKQVTYHITVSPQ
ncbi:MAG: hypothetical protein ACRERE_41260 [Candidatus Entotheonellia bacterium]